MTNTTTPMRHQPNPSAPGAPDRRRRETPHHAPDLERVRQHLDYGLGLDLVEDNDEAPVPTPTNRLVPPTVHNDDYQQTPRPECWN